MHNLSEEQLTKLYEQYQKADERREEIRQKNELLFEAIRNKTEEVFEKSPIDTVFFVNIKSFLFY